jgi:predicted lipid carrier protein YhbT
MATTSEIMQSLPGRFRPKVAGNLETTIQFRLMGEDGGEWFMSVAEGQCDVRRGIIPNADAIIIMDAADFIGINEGTVNAVDTFWGGRITVEGNIDAVLALPPVMDWI